MGRTRPCANICPVSRTQVGELSMAGGEEVPWWEEIDGQDNFGAVFPKEAQADNKAM